MENFTVRFLIDGNEYHFHGDKIRRDTLDGGGSKILYAQCYNWNKQRCGVVHLTEDWKIRSFFKE